MEKRLVVIASALQVVLAVTIADRGARKLDRTANVAAEAWAFLLNGPRFLADMIRPQRLVVSCG